MEDPHDNCAGSPHWRRLGGIKAGAALTGDRFDARPGDAEEGRHLMDAPALVRHGRRGSRSPRGARRDAAGDRPLTSGCQPEG